MNISLTHNMYFIAIMCPPGIDQLVLPFKYWMNEHFGCVVALRSPAHITIIQPFWLELNRERKLQETLQAFAGDINELEIQLDGFSTFGKSVMFIRVQENPDLEEIKKMAEQHFERSFGDLIGKDDRLFHPHVTIASRDLKPGDFEKAWLHFSNKNFKTIFSTRIISLLKLTERNWKVIDEKRW